MNCINCNVQTSNPKFCSKSCAAKHNNKVFPKRFKEGLCKICTTPIISGYVYCHDCFTAAKNKKAKIKSYKPKIKIEKLDKCTSCFTQLTSENRKVNLCKQCHLLKLKNKRNELKKQLIKIKGGCCEYCGYDKNHAALQFHHKDPTQKDFQISQKLQHGISDEILTEVSKCLLLCANCHFELHNQDCNKV